ncbi:MAG: HU family DNA-binding protein [Caldisericia bacterium]|nr:HU family DNA-binding protein [Caldisericia bacterium]
MTKPELIDKIAAQTKFSKKDCSAMLDATLESIKHAMKSGEKVLLVSFGSFYVRNRASRKGVNPKTRKPLNIPAKKVPAFKPGKDLKEAVKNGK